MMNYQTPRARGFKIIFSIVAICIAVGVFFLLKPQTLTDIKGFFSQETPSTLLSTLETTVENSGKLISNVDFSNAYLTNSGTFALTNNERAKAGLPALAPNATLTEVAKIRMNDMFAKGYFEHVSPSGDSAAKEANAHGYAYLSLGENIAMGDFKDDATLMQAWMNSPGHRANILNTRYSQLGVSVGKGMYNGKETWIAVQVFGKPLSACPAVDTSLKDKITLEQNQVNSLQAELGQKKAELDSMASDPNVSQSVYNQYVYEFNTLVNQTNALISTLKTDISNYNISVEVFNTCLANNN
jgi:uncharacterized protein YkwD